VQPEALHFMRQKQVHRGGGAAIGGQRGCRLLGCGATGAIKLHMQQVTTTAAVRPANMPETHSPAHTHR